ncbi:hypothetical protein R3F64_01450 [Halomonas sp. 5021]|uniref:hypothetical protein n=1 Tax=Halomonas sp. 5021 TaxID=3082156 RepID=UPI002FC72E09
MNQLAQACQGLNKCIGIINRNIHEDIDAQRAANISEARSFGQLPMPVERRLRDIVAATFEHGKTTKDDWFRIAWPGQEQHLCSSAYWIKRKKVSDTFEVVRGTIPIARFTRQKNRGELYANLAEAIEADLLGQ